MNKIKVLHILSSKTYNGAENVVCQINSMLQGAGDNIELIYCSLDGPVRSHIEENRIEFSPVSKVSVKEVRRVIAEVKPNIIHAHDMKASFVASLACGKIPLISHIHNNNTDSRKISLKSIYPCVFSYKGQHYMIPETSANQTVELYQAEDFPMKWKKVSNLITGERYVDTSVVKQGDSYFAVSYKKNEHGWSLDAFSLDMENNQMTKLGSKTYKTNTGRPGGGFICGENLERPAQNCASKYGENLIIYKIDQLDGIGYEEHEVGKVTVHDIPMKSATNRVHTYNQDSLYECVDVYFEKIDMLHGLKTLWRAYLRNLLSRK